MVQCSIQYPRKDILSKSHRALQLCKLITLSLTNINVVTESEKTVYSYVNLLQTGHLHNTIPFACETFVLTYVSVDQASTNQYVLAGSFWRVGSSNYESFAVFVMQYCVSNGKRNVIF